MTSASRSKGEDVTPDSGRVPLAPGSRKSSPDGLDPSGFDPSRLMGMFCAVANARYALEQWDREARWATGWLGKLPAWAVGPAQRGRQETEALREIELFLRSVVARDSDGSGEAGKTGTGLTEGDSADPKGIAPAVSHLTDQEGQNR